MKREIIKIDEEKCNGCGLCIPNCHEGALQLIDGKARLISDLMCDGLGACIGHCPQDAITIEEREAAPYDEELVMKDMIPKGKNTIIAHLKHLKDYKEFGFLKQGVRYLKEHEDELDFNLDEVVTAVHGNGETQKEAAKAEVEASGCGSGSPKVHNHDHHHGHGGGCPGSQSRSFEPSSQPGGETNTSGTIPSQLNHWPVQMHLINPNAPQFQGADLLLSADCVAYAMGDFHRQYLKGKALAIACPKLDSNKEVYVQKLISLINDAKINTITVMKMEVPCCAGILQMAQMAVENAQRKVPIKGITVSVQGEVQSEDWI
jgi:NAD-dependent dihydropyrimidine dehydrogenase PreA subunit